METGYKFSLKDLSIKLWNLIRGRKFNAQPVPLAPLPDVYLSRTLDYFQEQFRSLARGLASGDLSLDVWQTQFKQELEGLHTTLYILGRGGISQMTQADFDLLEDRLLVQHAYLLNWVLELQGKPLPPWDTIYNRSLRYFGPANASFQVGMTSHLGFLLPAYPGDGTTNCMTGCKCRWDIQPVGPKNYDCRWLLAPAEHCPTCMRRAEVWAPLQVRGGLIYTDVTSPDLWRTQ